MRKLLFLFSVASLLAAPSLFAIEKNHGKKIDNVKVEKVTKSALLLQSSKHPHEFALIKKTNVKTSKDNFTLVTAKTLKIADINKDGKLSVHELGKAKLMAVGIKNGNIEGFKKVNLNSIDRFKNTAIIKGKSFHIIEGDVNLNNVSH